MPVLPADIHLLMPKCSFKTEIHQWKYWSSYLSNGNPFAYSYQTEQFVYIKAAVHYRLRRICLSDNVKIAILQPLFIKLGLDPDVM